ncbi:MAG TPA: 3-oxoacyl-ACP reductase [Verrucomicrobiales bacterium]|nr:3-oxoacyl-ACP reductase [Verrucomicrobiales bacterium]
MDSDAASPPVAWITGAAGGLGQSLVEAFLEGGYRVAAAFHRTNPFAPSPNLHPHPLDVTDEAGVSRAAQELLERWGRIDLLINNAGITRDGLLASMPEEDWDRVMAVNLGGAAHCSRAVLPAMTRQGGGQILNISSFAARRGHAGQANYVASKAGLIGLTQSLARETGRQNIRVNAILPGVLPGTGMTRDLDPAQLERFAAGNALGRLNAPGEVARFVRFLATLENVSGQVFQLDSRVGRWT